MKKKQHQSVFPMKTVKTNFAPNSAMHSLSQRSQRNRFNSVFSQVSRNSLHLRQQSKKVPESDKMTQTTVRKNKKIVLKKGIKKSIESDLSRNRQTPNHSITKSNARCDDSFLDQTFRTSIISIIPHESQTSASKVESVTINCLALSEQFNKRRSGVYRLLSQLDYKFKEITNIQFKKKGMLDHLSQGCLNTPMTRDKQNVCMSLELIKMIEKKSSIQTSLFSLENKEQL